MIKFTKPSGGSRRNRTAFSKWDKKEGRYLVRCIFGPNRFPTCSLVFEAPDTDVSVTINQDVWKALVKRYRGFLGNVYVVIKRSDTGWEFVIEDEHNPKSEYQYVLESKNLIRRRYNPDDEFPY